MKITKEQVKDVAGLAKLKIADDELGVYAGQLENVLGHIEVLNEPDLKSESEPASLCFDKNVWRADEVRDFPEEGITLALDNAPFRDGDFLKVKKVL